MSKEVQKKEAAGALAEAQDMSQWGEQTITSQDIIIPKILPLQFMSEKVKDGQGKFGEFRDTLSNNLFGDLEKPFDVIPFAMEKKWIEFDMMPSKTGAPKREFKRIIPIIDNPAAEGYNDNLPLRDEDGGTERDRCMEFFVLIPTEVAAGTALPYVLSFRRTSLKAGKKLASQMYMRNRAMGKPPAATVLSVSSHKKENDLGEFAIQDINVSRETTKDELVEALKWLRLVKGGAVKVDESEFKDDAHVSVEDVAQGEF